jgi:hypothetical protein
VANKTTENFIKIHQATVKSRKALKTHPALLLPILKIISHGENFMSQFNAFRRNLPQASEKTINSGNFYWFPQHLYEKHVFSRGGIKQKIVL